MVSRLHDDRCYEEEQVMPPTCMIDEAKAAIAKAMARG
jgi:hypothetical protein